MKITDISVNRYVTTMMLYAGILVLGFVSYTKMSLDLMPDIEFPIAMVFTEYRGAGPKEIESNVTRPMEESLSSINNIDSIFSTSKEGVSILRIQFVWGTDMSTAVSDMRERIDIIKKFLPSDIETPVVLKFDMSMMPFMIFSITADKDTSDIREYAENKLKNLFEQIDGVAAAQVSGGTKKEVKIELVKNRMDAYNLSIDTIINILRMENRNVAGGYIKSMHKKFTLRTKGEFESLDDIKNIIATVRNNTPIYLKDIARIYEGSSTRTEIVRLNSKPGVVLFLNKQSDKNTVIVANNVLEKLEEIQKSLPRGMEVTPFFNEAQFIQLSLSNVMRNAIFGGLFAILVVFFFLRNIRSSLIIGASIPVSIITTFIVMYYFGISLNMMSIGGLAIGVGMLIDNSIVILENIFRYREMGSRRKEAAKLGTDEMAMAITTSTFTTMCVFVPFLFTEGLAGQLFKEMAITVSFALLCSLFVALTLIPMLTSRFIKTHREQYKGRLSFLNNVYFWSETRLKWLDEIYSRVIQWTLDNRKKTFLFTFSAIVFGLLLLPITGMDFMPEMDRGRIIFNAKLPVGTNLETTEEAMKLVEIRIKKVLRKGEYKVLSIRAGYGEGFAAAFGGTKDHSARVEVRLVMSSKRERTDKEIKEAIRMVLADIPGVTFNFSAQDAGGSALGIGAGLIGQIC